MSVFTDGALYGFLRRGLGSGTVRAEGNSEIDDVSSRNVVDETCLKKGEEGKNKSQKA